jgi:hypothetical protein
VLALAVALIPSARSNLRTAHGQIDDAHRAATQLSRLQAVIARQGGAARIKSCGQPVSLLTYQTELAWTIGLNVGKVGWQPRRLIAARVPIVMFTPVGESWRVRPINLRPADGARCGGLGIDAG